MKRLTIPCALLAGALLSSCSGAGHTSALPQLSHTPLPVMDQTASARVKIIIPAAQKTGAARHGQYISASTKSISFWIGENPLPQPPDFSGQLPIQTVNVTPGSPGCTTDSNGNTTCTATFGALGGDVQYTVSAYDGTDGQGNVLGTAQADATFTKGQVNNFSITLDAVVSTYSAALATASVPAGQPADVALTISAYDAGGNLIVNSPQLDNSGGGPAGGILLNTTNVDGSEFTLSQNGQEMIASPPGSGSFFVGWPLTGFSVHYSGGPAKNATFTLNEPGATPVTLSVGAAQGTAAMLYTGEFVPGGGDSGSYGTVEGFIGGANGQSFAVDVMAGLGDMCVGSSPYYSVVATDAHNNIAFISPGACGTEDLVAYTPGTGEAETPAWALTAIPTAGGSGSLPRSTRSIGFDSSNNIYMYDDEGPVCANACTTDIGGIDILKANSSGAFSSTSMDLRAIDCVNEPEAIAVAGDGTVYAAHVGDSHTAYEAIEVFAPGTSGYFECTGDEVAGTPTVTAERYIGGTNSGLDKVTQLALDSQGDVYAANNYGNSVTIYGPTANGNVAPDRTISGSDTGVSAPTGVAVDAFGNLYVVNNNDTITVYAPGASGDAKPIRTIQASINFIGNLALIK